MTTQQPGACEMDDSVASSAPVVSTTKKKFVLALPERGRAKRKASRTNSSSPRRKKVRIEKKSANKSVAQASSTKINQHEWATVTSNCCIGMEMLFFVFIIFEKVARTIASIATRGRMPCGGSRWLRGSGLVRSYARNPPSTESRRVIWIS